MAKHNCKQKYSSPMRLVIQYLVQQLVTRNVDKKTDRFAAFVSVFERLNKGSANNMSPDDYVAVDQTLYHTRGGILFKT